MMCVEVMVLVVQVVPVVCTAAGRVDADSGDTVV